MWVWRTMVRATYIRHTQNDHFHDVDSQFPEDNETGNVSNLLTKASVDFVNKQV